MLPKVGTPEWEKEVEWYKNSTTQERQERAQQLGYKTRAAYEEQMRRRGVYLSQYERPVSGYVPPPEEKIQVFPIPKIELRPPPVQEQTENDEEQVVLISDTQFGLKTKTYNEKVAKRRMLRLYNVVCRFVDIKRKFCPVKKLNIFLLGDIPQGELIGRQVMIDELELPLHEQKWLAVNELSNFIINACQWYENIDVVCVSGNHGVMGRYFSYAANWNIEIYDLLKAMVTPNYPQVKFVIEPYDFYIIHKIKNTRFLALHGDKIPMYLNLPWYGIDRRSLRWKHNLPEWDVLVLGHFHSCFFIQPSGFPVIGNGTLSSDSRFVAQWLGIREIAEMWTLFVGNKYGITGWHKIDLMRDDS